MQKNLEGGYYLTLTQFQYFLTDRTPSMKDAIRYIETDLPEASKYPIIVMAIEHDKIGTPLK